MIALMHHNSSLKSLKILAFISLAALLAGCAEPGGERGAGAAHPELVDALRSVDADTNILVVSFDALRADALGVYGHEGGTSPEIDRWGEEAFVFEQFYSAARATPTSFAAAFTGQYPFRVFRAWSLSDTQTLAEVMKNAGRQTFAVLNNAQLVAERNFQQGFEDYQVLSTPNEKDVVETASAALEAHADAPFFGWIHFITPHTPYSHREASARFYTPGYSGQYEKDSGANPAPESEADARRLRELYDGEVFFADSLFGQILTMLDRLQLSEETIVILTADHGDQFGEKGGYGHKSVYEGVVRVPFLMRPAKGLERQVRIRRVHINTDLLPTLAAAAGSEFVPTPDGVDMASSADDDRLIVITSMTDNDHRAMAARQDDDKLVVFCPPPQFREELYDIDNDPLEQTDRILDDPARAGELYDRMVENVGGDPCKVIQDALRGAKMTDNLDDETIERLKSLGYIQ